MLYPEARFKNHSFRKESLRKRLRSSPTILRWEVDVGVDDYRMEETEEARPSLALPAQRALQSTRIIW